MGELPYVVSRNEVRVEGVTELLTYEEHEARAMLLGRWYDATDGTYCMHAGDIPVSESMLDCITVEPISYRDAVDRAMPYRGGKPKPWEKPDD